MFCNVRTRMSLCQTKPKREWNHFAQLLGTNLSGDEWKHIWEGGLNSGLRRDIHRAGAPWTQTECECVWLAECRSPKEEAWLAKEGRGWYWQEKSINLSRFLRGMKNPGFPFCVVSQLTWSELSAVVDSWAGFWPLSSGLSEDSPRESPSPMFRRRISASVLIFICSALLFSSRDLSKLLVVHFDTALKPSTCCSN